MPYSIDSIIETIDKNTSSPRSCIKFPCGICSKTVKGNQKAIQCDFCDLWIHTRCNDILDVEYENLKHDVENWKCLVCCLKYNLDNIPYTRCDSTELNNINISNSMSFLKSLPNVEIVNETSKFSNVFSNEANCEIPSKSCSKYYSV